MNSTTHAQIKSDLEQLVKTIVFKCIFLRRRLISQALWKTLIKTYLSSSRLKCSYFVTKRPFRRYTVETSMVTPLSEYSKFYLFSFLLVTTAYQVTLQQFRPEKWGEFQDQLLFSREELS